MAHLNNDKTGSDASDQAVSSCGTRPSFKTKAVYLVVPLGLLLMGCGGSGAGNEGLFGGTTSTTKASNGLPFAGLSTTATDLRGQNLTLKLIDQYISPSGGSAVQISSETITFASNSTSDDLKAASVTIDGTSYVLDGNSEFTADGIDYEVVIDDETNVYMVSLGYVGTSEGLTRFAFAVTGFETSPSNLPSSGTGRYNTDFAALGTMATNDALTNLFSMASDLTLDVNFGAGSVAGNMSDGVLEYLASSESETETFQASLENVQLSGNGFEGDLVFACGTGFVCTDASQIGGVFYGPNAQETGGLATLDFTREDNGTGDVLKFDGAGLFISN